MATATKQHTAGELRKMQERASKAQETAQEQADALFLAQQEQINAREQAALKERLASAREDVAQQSVAALKAEFTDARSAFDHNKSVREQAAQAQDVAMVIMARVAFKTAIHPDVAGNKAQNMNGAASELGMPYSTLRPYVLAGGALFREDRAFLLSTPEQVDIDLVNDSFNAHSRKAQIEKRRRAAEKAAAVEAARAKAEAEAAELRKQLEQAQNGNGNGQEQAPVNGQEQAQDGQEQEQEQAPATGEQAPAQQAQEEQAQAPAQGPSVTDDILRTARELVRMSKAQRKNDNASWQKTHAELVKVLSDLFPNVGK